MVDENKLRLMTKAEMIKRQNRRDLFTRRTFFSYDFVIFGIIKSIIGSTVAYILMITIIFLGKADQMLVQINLGQLVSLAFNYINTYVLILVAALALSALQQVRIYHKTGKGVREYRKTMKALDELNSETEEYDR